MSSIDWNSLAELTSTTRSVEAVAVAARGAPVNSSISPMNSPLPTSANLAVPSSVSREIRAVPLPMMMNCLAGLPSSSGRGPWTAGGRS